MSGTREHKMSKSFYGHNKFCISEKKLDTAYGKNEEEVLHNTIDDQNKDQPQNSYISKFNGTRDRSRLDSLVRGREEKARQHSTITNLLKTNSAAGKYPLSLFSTIGSLRRTESERNRGIPQTLSMNLKKIADLPSNYKQIEVVGKCGQSKIKEDNLPKLKASLNSAIQNKKQTLARLNLQKWKKHLKDRELSSKNRYKQKSNLEQDYCQV